MKLSLKTTLSSFFVLMLSWNLLAQMPTTHAEYLADNQAIAERFAPNLYQFTASSPFGTIVDKPVRVDFDNDWDATNAWENTFSALNAPAAAYYHVFWTDAYWVVVYSFYYPRDWAQVPLLPIATRIACLEDQHENDVERVILYIKRASSINNSKLYHMIATNHGKKDHRSFCRNNRVVNPNVYASSGSHAMYKSLSRGYNDATGNPFCPPPSRYVNPFLAGSYDLVPVFEDEGLYDNRFNLDVFQNVNQFVCTDGGGCDNWPISEAFASAPWNGTMGKDPASEFSSLCNVTFGNNQYKSLDCNFGIRRTTQESICDGDYFALTLTHRQSSNTPANFISNVTWEFDENRFTCVPIPLFGLTCDSETIVLRLNDGGYGDMEVTASVESLDCGSLEASFDVQSSLTVVELLRDEWIICGDGYTNDLYLEGPQIQYSDLDIVWSTSDPNTTVSTAQNGNLIIITDTNEETIELTYTVCGVSRTITVTVLHGFDDETCDDILDTIYAGGRDSTDPSDPKNGEENSDLISLRSSEIKTAIEGQFSLYNYPNPFSNQTNISYTLPQEGLVRLSVTNMLGQTVAVLEDGIKKTQGKHLVKFDGTELPSGMYFYTLEVGNTRIVKKMQMAAGF